MRWYKFAQSVTIDPKPALKMIEEQVDKVIEFMERKRSLADIPINMDAYRKKASAGLSPIEDPAKRHEIEQAVNVALHVASTDPKEAKDAIGQAISTIMRNLPGNLWGQARDLYKTLTDLEDHIEADKVDPEASAGSYRQWLESDLQKGMAQAEEMRAKIQGFLQAIGSKASVIVKLRPAMSYDTGGPVLYPMDFSLDMDFGPGHKSFSPEMTVFTDEQGKYTVDDVLSFGDRDFFDSDAESQAYFQLVEFVRTGRIPGKEKPAFVKLYRGMNPEEFFAWERGDTIPKGKFFTSEPTAEYAQDISGEVPELFSFLVRNDAVAQTDPGTYQTMVDTTMGSGKRITPLEAS